jgi:hypothetical protein
MAVLGHRLSPKLQRDRLSPGLHPLHNGSPGTTFYESLELYFGLSLGPQIAAIKSVLGIDGIQQGVGH